MCDGVAGLARAAGADRVPGDPLSVATMERVLRAMFAARLASEPSKRMRRRRESRRLGRETEGGRQHAAPKAL
ncbi:hypothetical protein, partial [Nocardia sp. NPDC052112]|uniref:hypothetical protein n=1 Tax=Nocardia sp. NPDC052112 TaxID=3155646 RepID=UPI00343C1C40